MTSDNYLTRRGRKPSKARKTPAPTYDALLALWAREAPDDGRTADCGTEPWPTNVPCPDCGNGPVIHAEACFVPGHRICPWCGAHWSLDRQRDEYGEAVGERWILRRARFYGGAR